MKKLTKKEKLQKQEERYGFWRHCYILPLMGTTLLTSAATIISLIVSICTGSFAVTGILALTALLSAGTSFAAYKLSDVIDVKFYTKLLEIRNELDNLNKDEYAYLGNIETIPETKVNSTTNNKTNQKNKTYTIENEDENNLGL